MTELDPQARADRLLEQMTLDEKLAQLCCVWAAALLGPDGFDEARAREAMPLGIGEVTRIGGSTGLEPDESARLANRIQHYAMNQTRLGIPVLIHEEAVGGYSARGATVFPQAIALASSWDPALVEEIAGAIREELRSVGARHALAPVLDVARDPRWGRLEETYGEDPVLCGVLGTAFVKGLQTSDLRNGVLATGKHFAAHSISDGGRNHGVVNLGPRELREVYAEPFAAAIRDAGLASVMHSYSSIDGVPAAASPELLRELLRDELGFDGVVVADYFGVVLLLLHHGVAEEPAGAAALALRAGIDIELPATACYGTPLREALEQSRVAPAFVDEAVRRVLLAKLSLGLFDAPYVDENRAGRVLDSVEHRELAGRAAETGVVLLTNDGVLPLPRDLARIAVIGPGADDPRLLQGDYHYPAHQEMIYAPVGGALLDDELGPVPAMPPAYEAGPYYTQHVTVLDAVRSTVSTETEVVYERGSDVTGDDERGVEAAADAARAADIAVVVVAGRSGLHPESTVGEGRDATDLRLPSVQRSLVQRVAATGTPTVVVVLSGRAHQLTDLAASAGALLQAWPLGEEGGTAVARILFGIVNPAARLPVSLPRSVGQLPSHSAQRRGGDRSMFWGDYTDSPRTPLFPFGHGLSYTTFAYDELSVEAATTADLVSVTVRVSNTGDRDGAEVVQLYASDLVATAVRPERQLVGFARVELQRGQTRVVEFEVDPSRLAFFDGQMRFVVEPGEFEFAVGGSSIDLRAAQRTTIAGDVRVLRQRDVRATAGRVI